MTNLSVLTAQIQVNMDKSSLSEPAINLIDVSWADTTVIDSSTLEQKIDSTLKILFDASYLIARIEKKWTSDSTLTLKINEGPSFQWFKLNNHNVPEWIVEKSSINLKSLEGKKVHYRQIRQIQKEILESVEEQGYPFASVQLTNIIIRDSTLSAALNYRAGPLMYFKGINIIGNAKLSKTYLERYLEIEEGMVYSYQKVLSLERKIKELPFVLSSQAPTLSFEGDKVTINLFLVHKNASRFDFLVGLQPKNQSVSANDPNVRSFQLTGTFEVDFNNQFGKGERIYASFQQLRPLTQELKTEVAYPYLLDLPFGVDASFNLYKRDTSYLDINAELGVQFIRSANHIIRAFWNNSSTNVLSIEESLLRTQKKLPSILDVRRQAFGLGISHRNVDYRFNPRRGWEIAIKSSVALKHIRENQDILALSNAEFDFQSLYDSLETQSTQYQIRTSINYYLPIAQRLTFKTGFQGAYLFSKEPLLRNEQFRIGGSRLLRGFDEESLFVNSYSIGTLELRFLLGENSFLFAFIDGGYIEDITSESRRYDHPLGIGSGITFETQIGLFGFNLAVGSQQGQGFDFSSVKTHFGYISRF